MAISLLPQLLFIILLSPTIAKTNVTHAHVRCVEHEKALLLGLKNQLVFNSSHSKKLVQWNNETNDCCRWSGVECDDGGHVISLQLEDEGISGGFNESSSLLSLKYLEKLNLSSNRLESPIPNSLFNLQSLETLDLSNNSLSLDATSSNNFHPKQSSLQFLDLSNNKIGGGIPSWIWGNGSVLYLNLSCNMLVDLQKPYNVPAFHFLEALDLHSNQLRGELPPPPQRAVYVDYSNNYFDNSIPHTESFSHYNLQVFSLANNSLSGPFPTFICNSTNLQILDLSVNNFSGSIPPCLFENVKYLRVLNLGRNNFSGRILDKFSHGCKLRALDLSHNNLVGDVPLS